MRRSLRMIPVILLGSFAIAYVLARPGLAQRVPHLAILEFPFGALLIGLLLWAALARREKRAPPVAWRKHEQVVRTLPDPALEADARILERWIETGDAPEAAGNVLARASSSDPSVQERTRAQFVSSSTHTSSRRKREQLLKKHVEGV